MTTFTMIVEIIGILFCIWIIISLFLPVGRG